MEEVWKPVVGYEDYYKVSNKGRIFRIERSITFENKLTGRLNTKVYEEKELVGEVDKDGYRKLIFNLKEKGKKRIFVHRIVALAFLSNEDNLPVVNHKDGNKANNSVENLEWCTVQHNNSHARENGLLKTLRGEDCPYSKITEQQALEIIKSKDKSNKHFCEKFQLSQAQVSRIKNGSRWGHLHE